MDSALPNGQIHFELRQYCLRDSHGGNHGDSRHGDSRDGRGSLHGDHHDIRGVRSVSLGSEINSVLKYLWANWYWLDVVQLVAFAYLCKLLMMPTYIYNNPWHFFCSLCHLLPFEMHFLYN